MKHAVIVDAGSSGSRVFVYTWQDPATYLAEVSTRGMGGTLLPVRTMGDWVHKVQPGVSSFQGNISHIWKQHLEPLVRKAEDIITDPRQQRETPFYFLATAGLRLLPETDRAEILDTVCSYLQKNTDFLVPDCDTHVTMIDGQAEGLYGWLGLNYLVHSQPSLRWDNFEDTYGFLDMGGASAQLAFAADKDSLHINDLHTLQIRTVGGDPVQWHVFVTTWLGYGANQARVRLRDQIINELPEESTQPYEEKHQAIPVLDPCMPKNAHEIVVMPNNKEYIFAGSGLWGECEARVNKLLNVGVPCSDEPCLFDGVHVPDFTLEGKRFVGVSEYWYTLQDLFANNGKFDYTTLEAKVGELCSSDWAEIKQNIEEGKYVKGDGSTLSENEIMRTCFKSAWVLTVLNKGFKFPLSPDNKALDHNFQDTFQSAADIHGTEVSWTMGRAVLYASSQIEPSAGHENFEVGFTSLDGQFFRGGETATAEEIRRAQQTSWSRHPWILFLCLLFVLGIIAAFYKEKLMRSHRLRKLRRKLRTWLPNLEQSALDRTADRIGYGYSYPHAGILLDTFDEHGMSTSRTPNRVPSRVGSRMSLSNYAQV